jgi:hypothetical protein
MNETIFFCGRGPKLASLNGSCHSGVSKFAPSFVVIILNYRLILGVFDI